MLELADETAPPWLPNTAPSSTATGVPAWTFSGRSTSKAARSKATRRMREDLMPATSTFHLAESGNGRDGRQNVLHVLIGHVKVDDQAARSFVQGEHVDAV